jgi:hypothetical protein
MEVFPFLTNNINVKNPPLQEIKKMAFFRKNIGPKPFFQVIISV